MDISRLHILRMDPDGVIRLKVVGHITGRDTKRDGVNLIESVAGPGWRDSKIIIDFAGCEYMDSSALGWLIDSNKQMEHAGGKLVVHSLSETVKRVFAMTRMERIITIANTEADAAALLRHWKK